MPKWLLQIAVYLLVLINIALGLLMFMLSYQAILLAAELMQQGGFTEPLGPFSYVQRSVSSFSAILLGLLALVLFPVLERYYYRVSNNGLLLLLRFLRVVGIQLVYLGGVQMLVLGLSKTFAGGAMFIALLELATGILFLVYYQPEKQKKDSGLG